MSEFQRRLSAARSGDEASFGYLFRSTQPMLLRYLRALGGPLAEDCAAETWVSVVAGLDRFHGDESGWRAWVLTIARRRLVDARRRLGRDEVLCDDPTVLVDRENVEPDAAEMLDADVRTARVLALLQRLPTEQREAVFLRHVAGLDVRQSAEVLGRSPGSVRVATHRGLRRLASMLVPDSEPTEG